MKTGGEMVQLQVENQPSCHSPEKPPQNQSPSDSDKPNVINGNSFPRDNHAKVMENLIAMLLKFGASSSPTKSLTPKQKALIKQRLIDSFPVFHQPDHLPYAAMIETAIEKLDEKGGSSEEAISHFIRKEYLDLPWAHDILVKHHLENLCTVGALLKTRYGLYMTADKVSSDAYPLSPSSTFGTDSDFDYSLSLHPSAISNSDSDVSVCQIPARKRMCHKRKLLRRKVRTKRGIKEKKRQRKEDVAGEGMIIETNTSRVKQKGGENKKKYQTVEEYDKVNRFRAKRRKIKKHCSGEQAIYIPPYGHEDTQDKMMKIQMDGEDCHKVVKEKKSLSFQQQLDVTSELQPRQEAEVQEQQQEDRVIEGTREVTGLKEKSSQFVEETNHLQGHDVMPVKEQCYWQKKGQLPKESRKGQKVRLKPECIPGRCRGSQRKMDLLVNELNEDQKLIEVLHEIKRKNRKISVENCQRNRDSRMEVKGQAEHFAHKGQAEETEMFLESGKYETIVVGKTEEGKDETNISSLPKRSRKGRKVHPKSTCKPGRGRGQPCITDLPVEVTQLNPELKKAKGLDTITKEKREATEDQHQIRRDLNIGVEGQADNKKEKQHRQAGETKMVMEFREGQIPEKCEPGESRALETMKKDVNIVKCDEKKEQEKHIDDKDQSTDQKNATVNEEHQPQTKDNKEKIQQLENHTCSIVEDEDDDDAAEAEIANKASG